MSWKEIASCFAMVVGVGAWGAPLAAQVTVDEINPTFSTLDASDADGATGGRVNGLAADPNDSTVYYAASEWGGIYKSMDSGLTWARLDSHLPVVTWDVEVDPSNSSRVFATSFYDGRVASLSGINVSTDGGATWTQPLITVPGGLFSCDADRLNEPTAFGIGIDPNDTSNVYIGTSCGVAVSTDSGLSWTLVDPTPNDAANNVWDVIAHDNGSGQTIVDICGDDGHSRSTNGGQTWTTSGNLISGRCSIDVSPDEPYVLFAVVGTRIFESDDGGQTWPTEFVNPSQQGRIPFVATNDRNAGNGAFDLWFGDVQLHRAGCTTPMTPMMGGAARCPGSGSWAGPFTRSAGAHDDSGDIVFNTSTAVNACPTIFSSDGGVYRNTLNTSPACHSPQWEQPNTTPRGLWLWAFSGADQAGAVNEDLYFGNQDNGTFAATDGGAMTPTWDNVDCCDGFDTSSDPTRIVYTVCCFSPGRANRLFIRNPGMSGGGEINAYPAGNLPGFRPIDIVDQWSANGYVLVTTSGVFLTTNIGASPVIWNQLGTNPPPNACGVEVALNGATPTFYVQDGICNERNMANTGDRLWSYTGSATNGNWTRIDNNGLTGGVGIFGVDPNNPNRLYASNTRTVLNGGPQMVFSTDGGNSWQNDPELDNLMTAGGVFRYRTERGPGNFTRFVGYPQPTFVSFDQEDANIIVAGARDAGVFLSADGGEDWQLVTDPIGGSPNVPRPWFAYFDHEPAAEDVNVYVGTQGRGVWRLNFVRPPIADADGPYVTNEGMDETLDASGSSSTDGKTLSFDWDLDDDGSFDDATGDMPLFTLVGQDGVFDISVLVTDSDGNSDTDVSTVTVINVPPSVAFDLSPNPQDEGSVVQLSNGLLSDPGWLDPLTAAVDWGDGDMENLPGVLENVRPDATLMFQGSHVFLDNLPGNANYSVEVCGSDDDTTTCLAQPVQILNVAPTVTAADDKIIFEDDPLAIPILASFTDPGILDTHTAVIDWGDGTPPEAGTVIQGMGSGDVTGDHIYPSPGIYTVQVTVTDKDGGVGADSLQVTVVHGFLRYCFFAEHDGPRALTIGQGAQVVCSPPTDSQGIAGNGVVSLGPAADVAGNAVSTMSLVQFAPRVQLEGIIDAGAAVSLGTDADVTGDLIARGDVTLGNRASVGGDVTSAGTATLKNSASIGGTLTENAPLVPIPDITWVGAGVAAGTDDFRVSKGEVLNLPPGSYGVLDVKNDGTLSLSAGVYAFQSVRIGPKAHLALDFSGGPIVVDVAGDLRFDPDSSMEAVAASGGADDVLFRVAGSQIVLGTKGSYFGTFISPFGEIVMHVDATLEGALYGRIVDVHTRTTTTGNPALELFIDVFLTP